MIRRPSSGGGSNRYDDDDFYDNRQLSSSWDGRERRGTSRQSNDYDGDDRRNHHVDTVVIEQQVIEQQQKSEPSKPVQNWLQANIGILGLLVAICTPVGTFVIDLYDKVRDLEYKQSTIFEKLAENKSLGEEIKLMIKESEKNKKEVEQQINSLEDTIMQLYRKK